MLGSEVTQSGLTAPAVAPGREFRIVYGTGVEDREVRGNVVCILVVIATDLSL